MKNHKTTNIPAQAFSWMLFLSSSSPAFAAEFSDSVESNFAIAVVDILFLAITGIVIIGALFVFVNARDNADRDYYTAKQKNNSTNSKATNKERTRFSNGGFAGSKTERSAATEDNTAGPYGLFSLINNDSGCRQSRDHSSHHGQSCSASESGDTTSTTD